MSALVIPADLAGDEVFATTPGPTRASRRSRPGRLRIALLAAGLPILTAATAALVAIALVHA